MGLTYSTHTFRVVNNLEVSVTCSVQSLDYPENEPQTFVVVGCNNSAWTQAYGNSVVTVTCDVDRA